MSSQVSQRMFGGGTVAARRSGVTAALAATPAAVLRNVRRLELLDIVLTLSLIQVTRLYRNPLITGNYSWLQIQQGRISSIGRLWGKRRGND